MSREEALEVVGAHKMGSPVKVTDLQAAVALLARKRDTRCRLPALTEAVRAKVNLSLVWNLWQATKGAA